MILSTMAKSMRCILQLWFRQRRNKPNSRVRSFIYPYRFCSLSAFTVAKKPRETYKPWVPDANETSALETAEVIPCQGNNYFGGNFALLTPLTYHTARRGLLNLGQTCFLNVVLQCFVHNPLLRNYFLSDKHNYKQCKVEGDCTSCEMDKLFTEVTSFIDRKSVV